MSAVRRALAVLLAALALPFAVVAGAQAAQNMQTGLADDRLLLEGDATVGPVAAFLAGMGVDSVRLHARWVAVVPRPLDRRKPAGFQLSNPEDRRYNWAALDLAVRELRANGIEPILAVTGSGPLWASRNPRLGNPRYKPDPRLFGQFAAAVAKRYGAQVSRYLIWNEPNIPAWLQPQFECKAGRCVPESPHMYRELFRSAATAIRREDRTSQVMFGSLAPRGSRATSRNAKVRPLAFLRAMGCVTASYRRDRSGRCRTARAVRADAFSYHPHPFLLAPDERSFNADDAAIADLSRLEAALDRTTRAGLVKPVRGRRFDVHLTEFGYQTNPPDPNVGVSTTRQARWVQQATYLAWKDPRIKTITQYELQDEPVKTNTAQTDPFASWQSGMLFTNGRPKPLLAAFPNPFWVDIRRGRSTARFWGQVRPGGQHRVQLQRRIQGSWTTLRELTTNPSGYWTTELVVRAPGDFRFAYAMNDGAGTATRVSAVQKVEPGRP